KVKLKKVLKTTSFEELKKNEKDKGFSEAISYRENKNKKIPFFHLGPKNDWRTILNKDIKKKLEKLLEKELKELSYI
ncbi:sulfotransferase, partial [Candidatus Pelagibacter sp.]|nr:sulfotransferase [Candidatus Pelagibacter sp.]